MSRPYGSRISAHPSTSSGSRTRIPDGVVSLLLGLLGLTVLQVLTVGLESRYDVELLATALSGLDGTSIDHETRSVESTESHESSRHVLVASRNDDHTIEPMSTGGGLDLVGDEVSRLQRVAHTESSHRNAIRHSDGTELVTDQTSTGHRILDTLTKTQNVLVAAVDPSSSSEFLQEGGSKIQIRYLRVTLIPHTGHTDHGLLEIGIRLYTIGSEQHGLTGSLTLVLGDIPRMTVQTLFCSKLGRGMQAALGSLGIPGEDRTREHLESFAML
jgi:hypothetical protein